MDRELGLILFKDIKDLSYQYNIISQDEVPFKQKEWWDDGWWGDQKNTPHCNAYSWMHIFADGPVFQDKENPLISPEEFHKMCKEIDGISDAKGTTLHAGAKIAKQLGYLREYRWINDVDTLINALLIHGPVIAGTAWFSGMNSVDSRNRIHVTGSREGGHAYVINGVDVDNKLFRIKNSYGKKWGKNGRAYLSFDDMKRLFELGGSVCVPFIIKK